MYVLFFIDMINRFKVCFSFFGFVYYNEKNYNIFSYIK